MEDIVQNKEIDPARELAVEIFKFIAPKAELNTDVILAGVSMVLATIAVEAGMEEEKAVYAFRKSYGNAQRRLKRFLKEVH